VQAAIEDTLSKLLGKRICIYGASRTDTGVHARGQVANFWGDSRFEDWRWAAILNYELPRSIRILKSREVPDSWHAQRFALKKLYEYRVLNRTCGSALDKTVHFYHRPLDWEGIRRGIPYFLGTHDFAAFQAAKAGVRTTVRTIYRFDLVAYPGDLYVFQVEGNGFLKQMVRGMIGTLLEIGEGRRRPEEIPEILESCDRRRAGRNIGAEGLTLVRIDYPE
jgi:tRNA pseudouridine38-40 synthase